MVPLETGYIRLLAVLASPMAAAGSLAALRITSEWKDLTASIVRDRDPIYGVRAAWGLELLNPQGQAVLPRRLALLYHIVHFGCHCKNDQLLLEDETGGKLWLPKEKLAADLRGTGLVVLLACESLELGHFLAEEAKAVRCAIATEMPILDSAALRFAEKFYSELALRKCAGQALKEAKRSDSELSALKIFGDESWTPQLNNQTPAREHMIISHPPRSSQFPANLLEGFVGRRSELQLIDVWLSGNTKALTLYGPGGSGKSTFAAYAATRFAHRFHGVAYVSAKDRPVALDDILDALREVQGGDDKNVASAVKLRLSDATRPVLLVLDNVDSISEPGRGSIAKALTEFDGVSGSRVLLTSRPQSTDMLPGQEHYYLGALPPKHAVRLVYNAWERSRSRGQPLLKGVPPRAPVDRLKLQDLGRDAELPNQPSLSEIAAFEHLASLAEYHPYLLRLAGELAGRYSYEDAVERFSAKTGKDIDEAMHSLFGSMFDWLGRRSDAAQWVLYAALPFVGGAVSAQLLEITRLLTNDLQLDRIRFQDYYLAPAVESGLLTRHGSHYELDPPVRSYLEYRQAKFPGAVPAKSLLATYHAQTLLTGLLHSRGALKEVEWDNVSVALDRLTRYVLSQNGAAARDERTLLLVEYARMWREVLMHGESVRRLDWIEAARRAAHAVGEKETEATMLEALGDIFQVRGDLEDSLQHYQEALTLFRSIGSSVGEANVLRHLKDLGQAASGTMDAAQILVGYTKARQELHGTDREDKILLALADLYRDDSKVVGGFEAEAAKARVQACELYEEALAMYKKLGSFEGQVRVLEELANLTSRDPSAAERALEYYEQVLAFAAQVGDKRKEAEMWEAMGSVHRDRGRIEEAQALYEKALAGCMISNDQSSQANILLTLAGLAQSRIHNEEYDLRRALAYYKKAQRLLRNILDTEREARAWDGMGLIYLALNDELLAKECFATAEKQSALGRDSIATRLSSS